MPFGIRRSIRMLLAALLLFGGRAASAQTTALPTLGPITIASAVAGSQPTPVVNASTVYSTILVFTGQKKIVAQLNANMPTGVTLGVKITGASAATSLGPVNLDIAARDIVLGTNTFYYTNVNVIYTLTATVAAGVVPSTSRTVTFTLLNYP